MTDQVTEFVRLTLLKRQQAADLKETQDLLDTAEIAAREAMIQAGVSKISVLGMTVSPRENTYAKAKDGNQGAAVRALIGAGMLDYVGVGHQRLRALLKEDPDALPPEVAEHFDLTVTYKLGAVKT